MKKTVVIFESKYGSTKRYAEWIAEELDCPIFERKRFRPEDFAHYDTIIYGGGLYAGGVSGIKLLTRSQSLLKDKRVILFTCGLSNPNDSKNVSHIRESLQKALPPKQWEQFEIFHVHGAINYPKLSPIHRIMMAMMYKMISKGDPAARTVEDVGFLETYGKQVDFTDKAYISQIIEAATSST